MQVANLNQLVQNALQELDYLSADFVCSGIWCATTAAAYKRFLIDEKVDPHFAGVQPAEASHLPKTLFDYIFGAADKVADEMGAVSEAVDVVDLIAPGEAVIVNIGELSLDNQQAAEEEKPAEQIENENEQGEEKPDDVE